jgi:hypothetical protein
VGHSSVTRAGGITARLIGQWLSERLGQQFIIENRPGAGANERNPLGIGGFLTKHTWPAMWQFCNRPNGSGGLNENTRARNASPQNFVEARALGRERGGGVSVRWRKGAHGFTLHRGGRGPALATVEPDALYPGMWRVRGRCLAACSTESDFARTSARKANLWRRSIIHSVSFNPL